MNNRSDVRRALRVLAIYSLLFSFVVCPILLDADEVLGFIVLGGVALLPSVIYWIVARELLLSGRAAPWIVHLFFIVVIAPITFAWMFLFGLWAWSQITI